MSNVIRNVDIFCTMLTGEEVMSVCGAGFMVGRECYSLMSSPTERIRLVILII